MPKKSDPRNQVTTVSEKIIQENALELINAPKPVAIYTKSKDSITTSRRENVSFKVCSMNEAIDVSGSFVTGENGRSEFSLTDFICQQGERFFYPINMVATPFSAKPFFLTVTHTLVSNGTNVKFTVYSWDTSGKPAPNIPFYWRCRVSLPLRFDS